MQTNKNEKAIKAYGKGRASFWGAMGLFSAQHKVYNRRVGAAA